MKSSLLMDFVVNKENKTITVKRAFAAERPLVWDAFTKPEILDQWWAPKPWMNKTKSMDFRAGGSWLYAMVSPEGESHWCILNYISIEPQKGYTATDAFVNAEGVVNKEMPQATWKSNFSSTDDGTLVVFDISYDDLSQLEATINMGFKEGFTMTLNSLDTLLETLKK